MNTKIQEKLKLLPDKPGVYKMFNAQGELIYVGKAVNLKNRVRSGQNDQTGANFVNLVKKTKYLLEIVTIDNISNGGKTTTFVMNANGEVVSE